MQRVGACLNGGAWERYDCKPSKGNTPSAGGGSPLFLSSVRKAGMGGVRVRPSCRILSDHSFVVKLAVREDRFAGSA